MSDGLGAVIAVGPFVILLAACVLRAVAFLQPETSWSGSRRRLLFWVSLVLTAIALVGCVFLVFTIGALGVVGFMLTVFVIFLQTDAEVRIAGARHRARQVELVWLLAIAVRSGRPLATEIEAYAQGTWGRRHRQLTEMAERLREGIPLTELAVPQGLMPRSAEMQIHSGITSSSLNESLREAANHVTRQLTEDQETENASSTILYPVAIIPISFLIVGFVMYYIIPKFKKIFDDFGTELPSLTIALIQASDLIVNYWYIILLPFFYVPIGICVFVAFAAYYGWRVVLQSFFGRWIIRWHTPDVMRALSHGISRGIPLDLALLPIAQHPGPWKLRHHLAWAIDQIQSGGPSWQTLQSAGILRHSETVVLETAERTGNLPWALNMLATNIERQAAFRLTATLEIVRPILLLALSLFVGFMAVALFLPLIKLLNDLS